MTTAIAQETSSSNGLIMPYIVAGAIGAAVGVLSMLALMLAMDTPSEREEKQTATIEALRSQIEDANAQIRELTSQTQSLHNECEVLGKENKSLASIAVTGLGLARETVVRTFEDRALEDPKCENWVWSDITGSIDSAPEATQGWREGAGVGLILTGPGEDLLELDLLTFPIVADDGEATNRIAHVMHAIALLCDVALSPWPQEERRHIPLMWIAALEARGEGYTLSKALEGRRVLVSYIELGGHKTVRISIRPNFHEMIYGNPTSVWPK